MKNLKKDVIYLGSPLFLSKAQSKDFKYLIDKVESKLMGWRSKSLSWVGRSTLINLVAQAIPNYAMSFSTYLLVFVKAWMLSPIGFGGNQGKEKVGTWPSQLGTSYANLDARVDLGF